MLTIFLTIQKILSKLWIPISILLSLFVVFKAGQSAQKKEEKIKDLIEDNKGLRKLQDVEINTDRESALSRLRTDGKVRKD